MSNKVIESNSLIELSIEEQQHLSGGKCSQGYSDRPGELPPGYDKYVYHHHDVFIQPSNPNPIGDCGVTGDFGQNNGGDGTRSY